MNIANPKIRLVKFLKIFASNDCGNTAIMFAVAALPVVIVGGMAVDYMRATDEKANLQAAMDGAALAAVVADVDTDTERSTVALSYLDANYAGVVQNPAVAIDGATVTVSGNAEVNTGFMSIVGHNVLTPSAFSKAIKSDGIPVCVLALNQTAPQAVRKIGNSILTASDCAVQSNSNSSDGLHSQGAVSATADKFCSVGGHQGTFTPGAEDNCSLAKDPYAGLPAPADTTCDPSLTNTSISGAEVTLNPGVYCGGIGATSGATIHFAPGLYVVKDGELSIRSGSTADGTEVVFYLTGNNTGVTNQAGSSMTFSAPRTGDYAGLLIVQDPTSNPGQISNIIAGATIEFTGTIYLPTQTLRIQGAGTVNALSAHFSIIADSVFFGGSANVQIRNDPAAAGFPDNGVEIEEIVRLIE